MSQAEKHIRRIVSLKNVLTDCCSRLIELELEKIGVPADSISLGKIKLAYDPGKISFEEISDFLEHLGFEVISNREEKLVDEVKSAIINLIHHSTYNAMVRNSDFLVEKFNMSYQHLASIFKKHENITLEKYIILQKVEKVKALIDYDEMSLSEIAFVMGYSSVQYLSTQFKHVTGISVSDYKKEPAKRKDISKLSES